MTEQTNPTQEQPSLLEAQRSEYNTILLFLQQIGLPYRKEAISQDTFLPGILLEQGALVIDEAQLKFPGDILHEAGHLAVLSPEERASISGDTPDNPALEMAAIAWSWAAALHIGIDPHVVFHPYGYKGGGAQMVREFSQGRYFGVPMLQLYDMSLEVHRGTPEEPPFPHMKRWLRES